MHLCARCTAREMEGDRSARGARRGRPAIKNGALALRPAERINSAAVAPEDRRQTERAVAALPATLRRHSPRGAHKYVTCRLRTRRRLGGCSVT